MSTTSHGHLFIPGTEPIRPPLVLLHGSGGDEHELVLVAADVVPGSPTLGIRGTVPIDGGFAFFHRFEDRTIDEADITARVSVLADFIEAASTRYNLTRAQIAIGFSNGAIMAAALLLIRPGLLAAAILFRPLLPFRDELPTRLDGTPVLIIDGEKDSRRSPGDGARLADRLTYAGAMVTHHVLPVGHSITAMDREIAREWLHRLYWRPSEVEARNARCSSDFPYGKARHSPTDA
jgi:phospholipase/carboxylesterase